jgi:hypothetical protein
MQVHRVGVDLGQDKTGTYSSGRTNRAEDVGPLVTLIAQRKRRAATIRPNIGQMALLTDPGFILPPEFDRT